jgi:hypothetical protein
MTTVSFLMFGLAAMACGGSGGTPTSPAVFPVIIITNSWENEIDPTHFFLLASSDDGKSSGTFTGEETLDGVTSQLSGSWSQGRIEFTVQRDDAVRFEGSIPGDNPKRLELTSPAGALVIVQSS